MKSEILAKVIRGETVESVHRGHLIVVSGDGKTLYSLGNPETVTFWRSSAKAFQAIPFLTGGAAERFGYTEREIALACGSHSGERMHTETAAAMLEKINLSEADLRCGAHPPFDEKRSEEMIREGETPNQLHNNCSGKHAAMLAFCRNANADITTYEHFEHPLQKAILQTVEEFTDVPADKIKFGIDGCAAPNFAIPVAAMAKAFARLVAPPESFDEATKKACRIIVSAMLNCPEMIGGTDRLDTMLMQAGGGKLISKIGAEGVYSAAVLPSEKYKTGLGIGLKIEDGDDKRARAVVLIELLRQLGLFDKNTLREFSPLPIFNRRSDKVGETRASFDLRASVK
ncbi:MAG: asparaginase [Pyrinomonadaceae bacterium]